MRDVLVGDVLVTRNPCKIATDVRKVKIPTANWQGHDTDAPCVSGRRSINPSYTATTKRTSSYSLLKALVEQPTGLEVVSVYLQS